MVAYTRSDTKKIRLIQKVYFTRKQNQKCFNLSKILKNCELVDPITYDKISSPVIIFTDYKMGNLTLYNKGTIDKLKTQQLKDIIERIDIRSRLNNTDIGSYIKKEFDCCCFEHFQILLENSKVYTSPLTRRKFCSEEVITIPSFTLKLLQAYRISS